MHHAFAIEAGKEEGASVAEAWASEHLGKDVEIVPLPYGLLSVEDARRIVEIATQTSAEAAHRAIIITADRAYHEAQNALLKLFEEPAEGVYLFLCLPSLGGLLPTLRSRVQILQGNREEGDEEVKAFLKANKEKRSALIKKLTSGKDEEDKRLLREEAIALVNGIERLAYAAMQSRRPQSGEIAALLSDIAMFRGHLYDRSAPVKMILEHLSLVIPKDLL